MCNIITMYLTDNVDRRIDEHSEKYFLNWPGRSDAVRTTTTPPKGTLVPDRKKSVNFNETENMVIEGDNLEAMKLLRDTHAEKIKTVYIDPPYNTGRNFIYGDNFHGKTRQSGDTHSDASCRIHSNWLSFMYARLCVARDLLSDDGLIFISIDNNEIHNLRLIMNEIFGEDNYRNTVIVKRGTSNCQAQFKTIHRMKGGYEYVLMYSKSPDYRLPKPLKNMGEYKSGTWNGHWRNADRPTLRYSLFGITPNTGGWRWSEKRSQKAMHNYDEMISDFGAHTTQANIDKWYVRTTKKLKQEKIDLLRLSKTGKPEHFIPPGRRDLLTDIWLDVNANGSRKLKTIMPDLNFDNPKSIDLLERILDVCGTHDGIVLDFFAGSGTTAHAVLKQNEKDGGDRKFIMIQIPEKNKTMTGDDYETIYDMCRSRIAHAIRELGVSDVQGFKAFKLKQND